MLGWETGERPTERQTGRERERIKAGVCGQGAPSVLRWNAAAANFKDFLPLAWTLSPRRPGPPLASTPSTPPNNDIERERTRARGRETKYNDHNDSYISEKTGKADCYYHTRSTAYKQIERANDWVHTRRFNFKTIFFSAFWPSVQTMSRFFTHENAALRKHSLGFQFQCGRGKLSLNIASDCWHKPSQRLCRSRAKKIRWLVDSWLTETILIIN